MRRTIQSILVVMLMSSIATPVVHAAGSGGTVALTKVDVDQGQVFLSGTGMVNPDGCLAYTRPVILNTNPQFDQLLSVSLTAMATGKKVALWFSGCHATFWSTSEPVIVAVTLLDP